MSVLRLGETHFAGGAVSELGRFGFVDANQALATLRRDAN